MDKSFCFFFQKEVFLFFFEKKNQKTFICLTCADTSAGVRRQRVGRRGTPDDIGDFLI
jgi:hypothetical protein